MTENIFANQAHCSEQWAATLRDLHAERAKASGARKGVLTRKIKEASALLEKLNERGIKRFT
jgi:hypothetical protein